MDAAADVFQDRWREDLQVGFQKMLPVAIGVMVFGMAMGLNAATKGMHPGELIIMSFTVFAGSAQFVVIDIWDVPLPWAEILLATALFNARYLLVGASLRSMLGAQETRMKYLSLHLAADENWAMTMALANTRPTTNGYLLGSGLCLMLFWQVGGMIGYVAGDRIPSPEVFGLDFCFIAIFIALISGFWRGRENILPWCVTALTAWASSVLIAGNWYIAIGALCGLACVYLQARRKLENPQYEY
ncbi:MAG: AzlC family ABC transporter permease [Pseudomonadota bacterium]